MGVSQGTITEAQQHLDAVERYPELGAADVPRAEAIRLWQAWEAMTPTNRSRARKTWNAQKQATRDLATATADTPKAPKPKAARAPRSRKSRPGQPPEVAAHVRLTRTWYYFTAGLLQVINDFERNGGLAPLLAYWTPEEGARAHAQLQERAAQLARIIRELEAGTPKGMKSGNLRVIHQETPIFPSEG